MCYIPRKVSSVSLKFFYNYMEDVYNNFSVCEFSYVLIYFAIWTVFSKKFDSKTTDTKIEGNQQSKKEGYICFFFDQLKTKIANLTTSCGV